MPPFVTSTRLGFPRDTLELSFEVLRLSLTRKLLSIASMRARSGGVGGSTLVSPRNQILHFETVFGGALRIKRHRKTWLKSQGH